MKTMHFRQNPDAKSPAGADIRHIMDGETGNMIHSTVAAAPGQQGDGPCNGQRILVRAGGTR